MAIDISSIENKEQLEAAVYAQNCVLKDTEESAEVEGMFPTEMSGAEPGTEVLAFAGYNEFEAAADKTAIKIKEGFMEMGYILKIARDTDILIGSGYQSVEEFAQRRYDLDKGTVSRYIRIVERFSEGGDSHVLKENYRKMGFAKLSLMLHMPDAIAEELMESLSKNEVLAIKEELDAESVISDIELAIEKAEEQEAQEQTPQIPVPAENDSMLQRAVYQLGKEHPEIYAKLWQAVMDADFQIIPDILAPQGDAVLMVRIPGTGRLMLTIQGDTVSVTAVRTQEKEKYSMMELSKAFTALCQGIEDTWEAAYQSRYGILPEMEPEPEPVSPTESKVAPVQPQKEKRKNSKVTKAKPPKKVKSAKKEQYKEAPPAAVVEAEDSGNTEDEQIPGQDSILNHPEYMPDKTEPVTDGENPSDSVNTECEGNLDSTEEEANSAETDGIGEPGNNGDMSDRAGGDGAAEQSGASAGMDQESENVQESEKDTGTDGGENRPHSVITECEGNFDMTDEEWEFLWEDMARDANNLYSFLRWQKDTFLLNGLLRGRLEEHYKEAVNVAAGLEKMINGKKYSA